MSYVESVKYKMICQKSTKSSEFAFFNKPRGQKSLTILILSCFANYFTIQLI